MSRICSAGSRSEKRMIGVFDSGLGGLTVLKELMKGLPQYAYIYLGDSARAPYGNKSQAVIYEYTRQAVDFLFRQGAELIIIACNTASAKALRRIQQEWLPAHYPERRILGVIIPAAEVAAELLTTPNSNYNHPSPFLRQAQDRLLLRRGEKARIGVIGTRSTVESGVYEAEIKKILAGVPGTLKKLEIYGQACPLLVPLVEEGWTGQPETKTILKKYLRPLKVRSVNALILGCTHYPFLEAEIKKIMGKRVKIIDTPQAVAAKLADYLRRHPEIEKRLARNSKRIFYTTDEAGRFKSLAQRFMGGEVDEVEKVEL